MENQYDVKLQAAYVSNEEATPKMRSYFHLRFCRLGIASALSGLALTLPSAESSAGAQFPSHCTDNETVVFSCKVLSTEKYMSLCGSKSLYAPDAYLVYRFGTLNKNELVYPVDTAGSLRKFKSSHYFRAQVDRRNISFSSGKARYDVFSNFEGEESPPRRVGGVTVTMSGKNNGSKTLHCSAPYIDKLEMLEGVVVKGPDYLEDDE